MSSSRRFLRCDLLQAGDVILSRSKGKESKSIAIGSHEIGTDHWFSHAAIVLHRGCLFEAVDEGLRQAPLEVCRAGRLHSRQAWLHDISRHEEILVLRHPALEGAEYLSLADRLSEIAGSYRALEYPARTTLAKAAARSELGRLVAVIGLWVKDLLGRWLGGERQPVVPGPFCSMLVAILLRDLVPEHPLFTPPREPITISPNMLATDSCLRKVPDVILSDLSGFVDTPGFADRLNQVTVIGFGVGTPLDAALKKNREQHIEAVEIRRTLQELENTSGAILQRQSEWLRKLTAKD